MLIDGTKREGENTTLTQGGGAQIQGTSVAPRQGTRSGSFTNLNRYLDTNRDAARQTASRIENLAQERIQPAIQKTQDITQGTAGQLRQATENQAFVNRALSSPTNLSSEDVQRFTNLRNTFNANNLNQQNIQNRIQEAQTARTNAQAAAQGLVDPTRITETIRQTRINPSSYSRGSQALDNFIIQGTEEGQRGIQNVRQMADQLNAPVDFSEVTTLAQKVNPNLLTGQDITNRLNQEYTDFRTGLGALDTNRVNRVIRDRIFSSTPEAQRQQTFDNAMALLERDRLAREQQSQILANRQAQEQELNRNARDLQNLQAETPLAFGAAMMGVTPYGVAELQNRGTRLQNNINELNRQLAESATRANELNDQIRTDRQNPLFALAQQYQNAQRGTTLRDAMNAQEQQRFTNLLQLLGRNPEAELAGRIV